MAIVLTFDAISLLADLVCRASSITGPLLAALVLRLVFGALASFPTILNTADGH
jgi:hypothetical protein